MSYYLMLLKIRDISARSSVISKAKKYLKPGQKPPAGVQVHQGPRKGMYYNTEDLKSVKESKKKEAPKKEEAGEKKKRLPAFRKQEDGSVMHRTKDGEHDPGAYRIELKDGEHHLTFEGKDGEVQSLGKHTDIRELKRMIAGFKGGEKEKVKEEPVDSYNTHATIIVKNPDTDHERHEIYTTGDEGEMKHRVNQLNRQEGKRAYIIPVPKGKKTGEILDELDMKPREYSDIEKEAMAHPEYQKVKEKPEFIRGWKEAKGAINAGNTPEDILQNISDDTAWGGDNDYLHGGRMAMRHMLDAQDNEDIPAKPERKTKPRVKVPDEKPVSQVKDQKATVRRRKEADDFKNNRDAYELHGSYLTRQKRDMLAEQLKADGHTVALNENFHVPEAAYEIYVKKKVQPEPPKRELQYDPSKLVNQHIAMTTGSAMNKYIRDAAGVDIRDDKELDRIQVAWANHSESKDHKYDNAFASWHDFVNRGGLYNALSDSDKKTMSSYVMNQSNEDRGIVPKVPVQAIPMGERETKPSSPLTSGDKRHDPDQKKIATGLGTTEKKKAKESVAEFGVDTRQKIKEIAEKKTRQDRLSQNRLDTKN